MADTIGALIGLFGQRGLGLAQEAQRRDQQKAQIQSQFHAAAFGPCVVNPYGIGFPDSMTGTITTENSGTIKVEGSSSNPTEETALAWLDRRVDEMRVKL